ncbi:hypothetical protein KGQ64_03440 [bacterium]|nr:hypothetical protein [bacterium]
MTGRSGLLAALLLGLLAARPAGAASTQFDDGFETGDLSLWSNKSTKGSKLTVAPRAARSGGFGLSFEVEGLPPPGNKAKLWVKDTSPDTQQRSATRRPPARIRAASASPGRTAPRPRRPTS